MSLDPQDVKDADNSELPFIFDNSGELRRLGSLCLPDDANEDNKRLFTSMPVFEDTFTIFDDSDIKKLLTDPNRAVRREMFGIEWLINQLKWGSCNGHAEAGAYQRARYIRGFDDKTLYSGAWIYSLINGGRDNGSALEDGLKVCESVGNVPLSMVSADMIYPSLQPNQTTLKAEASKHKAFKAYAVLTKQGFRSAGAAGFMLIVAVNAGNGFMRLNSSGIAGVDNGPGNHAVCVDDMRLINGTEVFDDPNSWGPTYGQNGRAYLVWDHFAQTFGRHMFYAIPTTQEILA